MPVSFENRNFQKELDKKLELIKKEEKVQIGRAHV